MKSLACCLLGLVKVSFPLRTLGNDERTDVALRCYELISDKQREQQEQQGQQGEDDKLTVIESKPRSVTLNLVNNVITVTRGDEKLCWHKVTTISVMATLMAHPGKFVYIGTCSENMCRTAVVLDMEIYKEVDDFVETFKLTLRRFTPVSSISSPRSSQLQASQPLRDNMETSRALPGISSTSPPGTSSGSPPGASSGLSPWISPNSPPPLPERPPNLRIHTSDVKKSSSSSSSSSSKSSGGALGKVNLSPIYSDPEYSYLSSVKSKSKNLNKKSNEKSKQESFAANEEIYGEVDSIVKNIKSQKSKSKVLSNVSNMFKNMVGISKSKQSSDGVYEQTESAPYKEIYTLPGDSPWSNESMYKDAEKSKVKKKLFRKIVGQKHPVPKEKSVESSTDHVQNYPYAGEQANIDKNGERLFESNVCEQTEEKPPLSTREMPNENKPGSRASWVLVLPQLDDHPSEAQSLDKEIVARKMASKRLSRVFVMPSINEPVCSSDEGPQYDEPDESSDFEEIYENDLGSEHSYFEQDYYYNLNDYLEYEECPPTPETDSPHSLSDMSNEILYSHHRYIEVLKQIADVVEEMPTSLKLIFRRLADLEKLQEAMYSDMWNNSGDYKKIAETVICHQEELSNYKYWITATHRLDRELKRHNLFYKFPHLKELLPKTRLFLHYRFLELNKLASMVPAKDKILLDEAATILRDICQQGDAGLLVEAVDGSPITLHSHSPLLRNGDLEIRSRHLFKGKTKNCRVLLFPLLLVITAHNQTKSFDYVECMHLEQVVWYSGKLSSDNDFGLQTVESEHVEPKVYFFSATSVEKKRPWIESLKECFRKINDNKIEAKEMIVPSVHRQETREEIEEVPSSILLGNV